MTLFTVNILPDQDTSVISADLDHAVDIGAEAIWLPADISWLFPSSTTIDTTPASKTDAVINGAQSRGLPVIVQAQGNPSWIVTSSGHTYPGNVWHGPDHATERSNWVTCLHNFVNRYGSSKIHYLGVWNEPNLPEFWVQGISASDYIRLLHDVWVDVTATWPTIHIVGHNMARNDLGWIQDARAWSDIHFTEATSLANRYWCHKVGIHPYCGTSTTGWNPTDNTHADEPGSGGGLLDPNHLGYLRVYDDVAAQEGGPKGLVFGEMGYATIPSGFYTVTEAQRAQYMATALSLARNAGIVDAFVPYVHDRRTVGGVDWFSSFNFHGTLTETMLTAAASGGSTELDLFINGVWTPITSLVYGRDEVTITRGRSSEGSEVERSTCRFTVNNRSGDFSPRNPTGIYYGRIGRNTPMRVRVSPSTDPYALLKHNLTSVRTPDSAALSITGDLDVRIDLEQDDWAGVGLCGKWGAAGQRSWQLVINTDHTLSLYWSADGTAELSATSTAAATIANGDRIALRATIDVVNGANKTVTFYTAPTIDGSFSQLGSAVTTAGNTSIFDSTAAVQLGELENGAFFGPVGRVYAFQLYEGIAGTLRADVDHVGVDPTEGFHVDLTGNVWTPDDGAYYVNPLIRFYGEISDWPVRWDTSGNDVYAQLEASGILRRLGQGESPLRSTMYRGTIRTDALQAYWPCEDGEDSTQLASALAGRPPMNIRGTAPSLASNTDFKCSAALPVLNNSRWVGGVRSYAETGVVRVWFLLSIPAAGTTDGESLIHIHTTGTATRWRLMYGTGGTLTLKANDGQGTEILSDGPLGFSLNGKLLRVGVELAEDGADVDYSFSILEVGSTIGIGHADTLTGNSVNRCTAVVVNSGGGHEDIVIGHITVWSDTGSIYDLSDELNAHSGEASGRRIERLCDEEGIAVRIVGDPDDSTPAGYQLPDTLLNLLREAEDTDNGILYEPRDLFGLGYRTRESMYRQDAALTLDYDAKDLSNIEPTDDDQLIRNDITVRRIGGSSARATLETGPLSIQPPPDGIGRYDEEVSLSLEYDGLAEDMAGWRLHQGTVDEARFPILGVDLSRSNFIGVNLAQTLAVQDLDIGDRLVITDPPAWLPPDDISQLAQGFTETLSNFIHTVDINCSPETPWSQAGLYTTDARYSSDGTVLNEALDTTETGVDVAIASGILWDDTDQPFNIVVGGEVMTVTAVSGASSPQTFTVTRSVNGVVKSHASGAAVALADPTVYVP
jgi:hypothetical protein